MRTVGEGSNDPHGGLGRRIGRVDDAKRRLARANHQERRTYILSLRQPVLHAVPGAELFQRRLPYLPAGTASTLAMESRPPAAPGRDRRRP